jgi:hypothetical protein
LRAVIARLAVLAALVAAASGCGGKDPAPSASATPAVAAEQSTPAAAGSGANAFIGSLAVDPKDGTLMLGTGLGLFRVAKGAGAAERVVGELRAPDGSGPVSSNLVVRYPRPGELLASGHPEGGGPLPENLGLILSRDAGKTWEPVAELGQADYHILQADGDRLLAVGAEQTDIRVSADGGHTFETRTPPDAPLDVAFDAKDPARMVVTTAQGVFSSSDEGRSWRPRDGIPADQLAWAAPDALYRADPGGLVKVSADGGATWQDRGSVGPSVNELAVDGDGALYASVPGGEVKRSTDGGATWASLVKLK